MTLRNRRKGNGHLDRLDPPVEPGSGCKTRCQHKPTSVHSRDEARRTALHWNALKGRGRATQYLVSQGCDVEALDHADRTALYIAAAGGNESVARCLLRNGARLEARGGRCPLEAAATNPRSLGIARMMLGPGRTKGRVELDQARLDCALHAAVDSRNVGAVRLLLSSGADANAASNGLSCLNRLFAWETAAAAEASQATLELLLAAGAEPNARGSNGLPPVHSAASAGDARSVARLILAGARLEDGDAQGATALHHAVAGKDRRVVELLLASGARVDALTRRGDSPLHYATRYCAGARVAARLLAAGADPNRPNDGGQTPTHLALEYASPELVELLVGHGADLRARDAAGRTVLHYAVKNRQVAVLRALVDCGVDVSAATTDNVTALHLAAEQSNAELIRLLVRRGARVNAKDARRCSALHYCIDNSAVFISGKSYRRERLRCVEALLDNGLDVNEEVAQERQILKLVVDRGEVELTHLVVESLVVAELRGTKINECHAKLVREIGDLTRCYEDRKAKYQEMQGKKVFGRLSLFDLVTIDARRLAKYVKNIKIDDVLDYCQTHFPACRDRLEAKLDESLEMREITHNATLVLADIFQFANFSVEICEEILSKMPTEDLGLLQARI